MRQEQTDAQMAEVVVVDVLHIGAVALTCAMQMAEQLLILGISTQNRITARKRLATQRINEAETWSCSCLST